MECTETRTYLSDYIDNDLETRITLLIDEHLEECSECAMEYGFMKNLILELGSMEELEAPTGFAQKVHERLKTRTLFDKLKNMLFISEKIGIPLEVSGLAVTVLLVLVLFGVFSKTG